MIKLSTPVTSLRMIGGTYSSRLKRLGIKTIDDLLYHIPFRYEDLSMISKIALLQLGEKVTVIATITSMKNVYTKHGKKIQKAKIADETGKIDIIWYNQPFLTHILKAGIKISIAGQVRQFGNKLVFESPDYEIIKPVYSDKPTTHNQQLTTSLVHTGRLVPIYPETEGVSSKWLRSRIWAILTKFSPQINEFLPLQILSQFDLLDQKQAIYKIHFPPSEEEAGKAKKRLAFDELLMLQLAAKMRKKQREKIKNFPKINTLPYQKQIEEFIKKLPFELTTSQTKAIDEISPDLDRNKPMNRLLEGDVGSGKTVVAAILMYLFYLAGFQSVLMAPTEILAEQHYQTISDLLSSFGVKVGLIAGGKKYQVSKQCHPETSLNDIKKKKIKTKYLFKNTDILVGTHALLFNQQSLPRLGLVVIDEQQRFGVKQRASLRKKGVNPHVLILTATPIPRTIALTLYADLDLSVIDENPPGRLPVKTWVVPPEKRKPAYVWISKQINKSKLNKTKDQQKQAFIICPLIEESESLTTVKAATVEYDKLKKEVFKDLKLGLLHGRLKQKEKDKIFAKMKKGEIDILVATPVVEVGIDIPCATIMMIEAADRFGLAQLHQLRGRVGRRKQQAYCLLFSVSENPKTINRLKLLERTYSGPKLAELDLKLRGAGDLFGTRQHGFIKLKTASLMDLPTVKKTKKATEIILSLDSSLFNFPLLKEKLEKYKIEDVTLD